MRSAPAGMSAEARRETAYVRLSRVQGFRKLGRINRFTRFNHHTHRQRPAPSATCRPSHGRQDHGGL